MVITDEKKFDSFVKKMNLADETLISFLQDNEHVEYATKDLATYQLYLKNTSKDLTLFQRAGKAAGNTIKSIGAAIGSMAATWAIGEVLSAVA